MTENPEKKEVAYSLYYSFVGTQIVCYNKYVFSCRCNNVNPEEVVIDGKNMKTTLVRRIYGK